MNSEYTQPLDWADVERGMMVELRHERYPAVVGEVQIPDRSDTSVQVGGSWYHRSGEWSLWVKPEPVVDPLPTEPGYYLDREGDLWRLVADRWVFPESDYFAGKHERYAPFTRLLTGAEWETTHPRLPKHAPLSYGSWSVLHKQGWDAAREYLAGEVAQ